MKHILSPTYVAYLKRAEGFSPKAYKPKGERKTPYFTIGYGHYGSDVQVHDTVTESEAEFLLLKDLEKVMKQLDELELPELSVNRYTAVVDFCFNLGVERFKTSTLYRLIKAGASAESICKEFRKWVYSGKTKLRGLVARRGYNCNLWMLNE